MVSTPLSLNADPTPHSQVVCRKPLRDSDPRVSGGHRTRHPYCRHLCRRRQAWPAPFKADEAFPLPSSTGPIAAYLAISAIIDIARKAGVDAIHPGYGFLSESPDFADACAQAGIVFIGPEPETMRALGDKVSARQIAIAAQVPVIPASGPLPIESDAIKAIAAAIGYPLMLKASWGGGGRGMRIMGRPTGIITSLMHDTPANAMLPVDLALDLFLELPRQAIITVGTTIDIPPIGGMSGCAIWQLRDTADDKLWSPDRALRLVGVQSSAKPGNYFRGKPWTYIPNLLKQVV